MSSEDHKLWVSLSSLGEGNVFAVLPRLLQQMFNEQKDVMDDTDLEFQDVILPSDDAWQTKIYYKLVERQRIVDARGRENNMLDNVLQETNNIKLHEWNFVSKVKLVNCESTKETDALTSDGTAINWTVGDIAKAGCLLTSPPIATEFEDEQEMRRVYTLIYDVFRYKNVLTQALNDVSFFQIFPKLLQTIPHVWLLFYDLYYRSFKKRETKVAPIATHLFNQFGLSFVENALWTQRVKLAAAVARLRIKHNALTIGELLPPHLKDERVTQQAKNNPVTCWVNVLKVKDIVVLCKQIEDAFGLKMVNDSKKIGRSNFKWDRHCPQIIAFHSSVRGKLARSDFVKNHLLIVQDKSFCLGPATFGKIIRDLELTGTVIQTHVNSPRTTAYLATLLSQNEKIKKLMAFSAGKRKTEYESYFHQLGMRNIIIFSDRLIDTPADAMYLEEVVAVFATPPNSYSAVADPIDLVCSRGGDLSMLEVLTESGDTKEARDRVATILDEQKRTLRFAMSRPQIQFVLYETHSELEVENNSMVHKALDEINRVAKIQHATLQGKLYVPGTDATTPKEINNNEKLEAVEVEREADTDVTTPKQPDTVTDEKVLENIKVPDTDIFHTLMLPKLCPSEKCDNFEEEGCYLALLQRKQVIRLDDKYMIQMAENRGLFGSNTTTTTVKSKSSKSSKKSKPEPEKVEKSKKKFKEPEIDRIAAPTQAFLRQSRNVDDIETCKRLDAQETKAPIYKAWWKQTARHIIDLKQSLIKQKILPKTKTKHPDAKAVVNTFWENVQRVDELAKDNNSKHKFPVYPKLRLPRESSCGKIDFDDYLSDISSEINVFHDSYEREDRTPNSKSINASNQTLYRDVGVLAKAQVSKNILAKLSSAQIRQFVSPFYKEPFIYKNVRQSIAQVRTVVLGKKSTQAIPLKLITPSTPPVSTESPTLSHISHFSFAPSTSTKSKSSFSYNTRRRRIAALIKRLRAPTQNVLLKALSEDEPIQQRPKKPAIEYTKRLYHCPECRKRNLEDSRM